MLKKRLVRYFLLFFIIALACNALLPLDSDNALDSLYTLGYICTIELLTFVFCSYRINNSRLNYSCVFMLVLFLFHFGQLMLFTYFQNTYEHIRFLILLDEWDALYGFKVMNYAFLAMCIGILGVECCYSPRTTPKANNLNKQLNWQQVARIIILTTFCVKLPLDLITLFITITKGGVAARVWVNSFPNILLYYGKISLVGFALLIMSYKEKHIRQLRVFVFIELYILVMMMSGIRSENVGYLLVFLFVYIASRRTPIKPLDVIVYGFLGVIVLTFVVAVGQFRTATDRSLDSLLSIMGSAWGENNVFLELMDVLGDTGYTCQAVINNYLPHHSVFNGKSYILGLSAVIPNVLPFIIDFGNITTNSCFPVLLQQSGVLSIHYQNIGGSLMGEFFFNFGVTGGVVAAFFFGLFMGWVSKSSSAAFAESNYYKQMLFLPMMLATIYWVRDYFGGGVREAAWGILFAYFVIYRFQKRKLYVTRSG